MIWGFYEQGNIGDDLMGMIFYELIEELGGYPILFSNNPRFTEMGYRATTDLAAAEPDILLLGGGAFFKNENASTQSIEGRVQRLADYVNQNAIPVHGVSLGSDGIDTLDHLSLARKALVRGGHLESVAVRLESDLALGLPNARHLDDVVLLTSTCASRYKRLTPIDPPPGHPNTLINLSRRKAFAIPRILWKTRKERPAFFRAHTSAGNTGGEITVPGFPVIEEKQFTIQLGYIKAAKTIISSKLHPGVMAVSFGNRFEPVSPRPKTIAFLKETLPKTLDFDALFSSYVNHIRDMVI
ncbi:MAG: hypothetical protein RLQ73_02980 [Hoeflea sp. D1-CHI-28]